MRPLEQETSVEVLREYGRIATLEVQRLKKLLEDVQSQSVQQEFLSVDLKDQLSRLQAKFFGFGREKSSLRPVSSIENDELLLHTQSPTRAEAVCETTKAFDREKYLEAIYELNAKGLEDLRQQYGLTEDERFEKIPGLFQDSFEITVHELVYKKIVHRQQKYRLISPRPQEKEVIVTSPGPVKIKKGSGYSVDFALNVVLDKYEYHLPLERQRRRMQAAGLSVSVKSLYGLCEAVAGHCEAVCEGIRQDILKDAVATHIDETTWPLKGQNSQSYMWSLSNRSGQYYQFEPTRSGRVAEEMLKGFSGCLMSDGFSGYNQFKVHSQIKLGNCWAHARREFFELQASYPKEGQQFLGLVDELFVIERKAQSWEQLHSLRQEKSRAQIKSIYEWLIETKKKHLRSVGLSKAIDYCLNRWAELTAFLDHLALPLSNNDAERSLRHVVMGRKNFNGSKTINGADVASCLYTVIETCKKVGLKPRVYLKYLIEARWHQMTPLTPLGFAQSLNQTERPA